VTPTVVFLYGPPASGKLTVAEELARRDRSSTLYAFDADACRIFGWRVGDDGWLAPVGSSDGLPATTAGLAAG